MDRAGASRVGRIVLISVLGLLVTAVVAVMLVTNTNWGREQVRRQLVGLLDGIAEGGTVQIGRLEGNLLRGFVAVDLSIVDAAGEPLLTADTAQARFRILRLARQRLDFTDVRIVNPLIVLDHPPGEEWNFYRIFPRDTLAPTDTGPSWGSWVRLEDVSMIRGRVIVRVPWDPDTALSPSQRQKAIDDAIAEDSRLAVRVVPNGWQAVYDFRDIHGEFPLLRIADPRTDVRLFDVAALRMEAYPFRPPAAQVRNVRGRFLVDGDSLWWREAYAELPASRISGAGTLAFGEYTELRLRGAPIATADLQWLFPELPDRGGGSLDFVMRLHGDTAIYEARGAELQVGDAGLRGDLGLVLLDDQVQFRDTDLRFTGVSTELIELFSPEQLPRRGTLSGRAALDGPLTAMRVDADVTFDDRFAGRNRVVAVGDMGIEEGTLTASGLRVSLRPLQMALVRGFAPDLPLVGVLTGDATLTGSTATRLRGDFDLAHAAPEGTSRARGSGELRLEPTLAYSVDAQLSPLVLATAGRFAPALQLRGSARGPLTMNGTERGVTVRTNLGTPDGGRIAARGRLDFRNELGYDMRLDMQTFDASVISGLLPPTSITGWSVARGQGTDPATARGSLAAEFAASRVQSVGVDSLVARVDVGDGLASVERLSVLGPGTAIAAAGTLGLRADRSGQLTYRVVIDSLGAFSEYIVPSDTAVVRPRPGVAARVLAQARADSARRADSTLVERIATGAPPPALEAPPMPQGIARDSVAGSVYAAGIIEGNIERFDARGRLAVAELVAQGNEVRRGRVEYAYLDGMTPTATIVAAAQLDSVFAAGFTLDSVDARLAYQAQQGTFDVVVNQTDASDLRARANFRLDPDDNEILFERLAIRLDTTHWVAAQPGRVQWGGQGILFDGIELRAPGERFISLQGVLPTEGEGDLQIRLAGLQVADIISLLQGDDPVRGLLTVSARLTGSATAPRIAGALAMDDGQYENALLPDLRGTFVYEDRSLSAHAAATPRGSEVVLATMTGVLPVDLALRTDGPRLPDAPVSIDFDADSLPVGVLGELTDIVSDVDGRAAGAIRMRGTLRDPQLVGALRLSEGQARVDATGVRYDNIAARLRLEGETVYVDSLVAFNAGRLLVRGSLGIASPSEPSFDLYLVSNGATVLDDQRGRLRADAGLAMRGPFDDVYISGAVRITEGVLRIEEPDAGKDVIGRDDPALYAVVDTAVAGEAELLPERSPLLDNLRMDVNLAISRDTWVRSRDANIEIYTPDDAGPIEIALDQRRDRLVLRGVISTERGEYRFLQRRFEVDRGSVIFVGSGELNPLLQITGRYEVRLPAQRPLTIRVLIGGTLNSPQLSLESDAQPPLSESDLISYLAFGRATGTLLTLGEGSSLGGGNQQGGVVGAVGAAATQRLSAIGLGVLVDQLEGETARALGADVINITPAEVAIEASNPFSGLDAFVRGTEIEAGRYIDRRSFLSFTVRPSLLLPQRDDRFIPGVRLQHRFGPGLRLETSFEGRYVPQEPSLEQLVPISTGVFGLFLIREWGW